MTDVFTFDRLTVPSIQGRPLTLTEFVLLREHALHTTGESLELIDGVLVGEEGPPYDLQRPTHPRIHTRLNMLLAPALAGRRRVQANGHLHLPDGSYLVPDLAILPLAEEAGEVAWAEAIIEVARSSYQRDMGVKPDRYAWAGVPEYWVVDLAATAVHVHRDPDPHGYRTITTHRPPVTLRLVDTDVPLADLLGPPRTDPPDPSDPPDLPGASPTPH